MLRKKNEPKPAAPEDAPATPLENAAAAEAIAEAPSAEPAPPPAEPGEETRRLQDQLLRLQADFDNFRKRTVREREALYRRANEDLIGELLPVLDHFELGMKTAAEHHTPAGVREGFQLVQDQLVGLLKKFGLEAVPADQGAAYDPHGQECIALAPSEEVPQDHILLQTRRGYRLGDLLLRAAQVVVSSGPEEPSLDEGEASPAPETQE